MPITVCWPSRSTSTTTTQLRLVGTDPAPPNFTARSTTGTTLPRRLMTPRMNGGALGIVVTTPYSMISFARRMRTPYSSSPTTNVRYCVWRGSVFVVVIALGSSRLEPREVRLGRGSGRSRNPGLVPVRLHRSVPVAVPVAVAIAVTVALAGLVPGERRQGDGLGAVRGFLIDPEERHQALERLGLRRELRGGRGELFSRRGAALGHLVHLAHGLIDLIDARGLLPRGRGDFLHQLRGPADGGHQLGQPGAGLRGDRGARTGDVRDGRRGHLAALRQLPDFRGDHGEAAAVLAGAGRFDRGIQRQKVGLISDVLDDPDLLGDGGHRGDGLLHRFAARLGIPDALEGHGLGLTRVLGILGDGGTHLFQA